MNSQSMKAVWLWLVALAFQPPCFAATTNLLSFTTFQYPSGIFRNSWGYSYSTPALNGASQNFAIDWYDEMNDPAITNYLGRFTFDDTVFKVLTVTNASASYGTGFGGSLNLTNPGPAFASGNRADYLCSFDLRAEGFAPGVTSAAGGLSITFEAEDNTIQPRDADSAQDTLLRVDYSYNVRSNWTHFAFRLSQGSVGGGSDAIFAQYHTNVNNLMLGVNFHRPGGAFGFDSNNVVYIDNIRLDLLSP